MYRTRRQFDEKLGYGFKGKPKGDDSPDTRINSKGMKDLPHSSYSFKADPYTAALPTSEPYPPINQFNKVVGGTYPGDPNIDGGNVQQYANSTTSSMLKAFDEMRMKIGVNYRYLPILPQTSDRYAGKALIDEMRKSIAESVSILNATTFTQMAINNFAVETDLPMGSAEATEVDGKQLYTNLTDVLYSMSIYYQTFLQEGLSVMNWHNSFRLKQGVAIKNAWNREVPSLNAFFGLMNKSSFLNMLNSINLSFEGEYIDKEFMEQINTLTLIPSRRANSFMDPILELQVDFHRPTKFKVWLLDNSGNVIGNEPIYDDASLTYQIPVGSAMTDVSYWQACSEIKNYLSLESTQLWARDKWKAGSIALTDNARFNQIKSYFDVLVNSFTKFKPTWSDYREALDVMVRTGTISWTKGFRPGIIKDTNVDIFWNVMIDHIYQMVFSGSNKIEYDDFTKRWRTFSLWNMYSGTPEYDKYSGGCFLTFSSKEFDLEGTSHEEIEYLPLLFAPSTIDSNILCVALSRDGKEAIIKQYSTKIQDNVVLNRLAPLASQSDLEIRIPTITFNDNNELTKSHFSYLYKMMTQVFGMARIQYVTNGAYDIALDPDLLSVYQIEINDITNISITYARSNAPFRGTSSDNGKLLGFGSYKS